MPKRSSTAFEQRISATRKPAHLIHGFYRSTVMCNQYYFYAVDDDFGPFFIKFSSYFPYTVRINLNGHEYAKRQLEKESIAFEELDNGVLSCENPKRLQQILDDLDEAKIESVIHKWFNILPHPFAAEDQEVGFRYRISILQAEFAKTQVFDRPLSGRQLFEEVIRENIDLGRPGKVSLLFNRRITKRHSRAFLYPCYYPRRHTLTACQLQDFQDQAVL